MFGKGSVGRAALISAAILAVVAPLAFFLGPNGSIGLVALKVVNDTDRPITVQPCWDPSCSDIFALRSAVVGPHRTPIIARKWLNDVPNAIAIAIVDPGEPPYPPFDRCVIGRFPPKIAVAVLRVSEKTIQPCPEPSGGGGAG